MHQNALDMIREVSNNEVKDAMLSIDDNKASGPDRKGKLLGELNVTLITLVPKYLRLTQESQTPKRIEDMTMAEYLKYEKKEFAHYFGPNQLGVEFDCDSKDMEEEVEYMTNDEVVMSEKEESNHGYTQNIQHFEEKDDVDKWLNAEITKHIKFEQKTRSHGTPKPQDEIAGLDNLSPDRRGLVKRWHVCKHIHVTYDDGSGEYYGMWVFNNEIEHLSNEYILRIGKKGYVLDDVWEKCQQNYKKTNEAWHEKGYEEDEMWRRGHSFICITDREDEALPLGRVNVARFKAMIRKELEGNKYVHEVT
ncbi:hypothetical protein Tco_0373891 [Tanacetum coccineum]